MADYFGSEQGRRPATAASQQDRLSAPQTPGGARRAGLPPYASMRMPSNIRIRRLASNTNLPMPSPLSASQEHVRSVPEEETDTAGRRRSLSAPQRPFGYGGTDGVSASNLARQQTVDGSHMPAIRENTAQATPSSGSMHPGFPETYGDSRPVTPGAATAMHSAGNAAQRSRGLSRLTTTSSLRNSTAGGTEYESDVIDLLDLVDPEIRTLGTLTNLQNSLFVPDLGGLVNRRPTYDLTRRPTEDVAIIARSRAGTRASRPQNIPPPIKERHTGDDIELQDTGNEMTRQISISSELSDSHYAVLPHGVHLEGWDEDDIAELNDHVRHLLHSKREGFKRSMRGFKQYISKPLGFFVFLYATLVTLFGAAWVFALIGWVYVGNRQQYFINTVDLVLVALFALMGDGLAPFRAVDTYHMCFIAHYHHLTWKLRQKKKLPELVDHNDLPARRGSQDVDDIIDKEEMAEYSVLSVGQQKRLQYHQAKFNKSHTFYKPHETATHHAFPLRLLVAAVVLLDCHSFLQIALGTCTWSISYDERQGPLNFLTPTILSCSIACNIAAGVVISIGDHKTRKKDVLERMFRQGLTEEALKRMANRHERGNLGLAVDRDKVESGGKVANAADAVIAGTGPKAKKARKSMDVVRKSMDVRGEED